MICGSRSEARSFESCWNFLLYLVLHFLLIALQNTSLTASKIAVPQLSNIALVATKFWPRCSAKKRDPNKLGTRKLDTIPADIALDMGLWRFRLGSQQRREWLQRKGFNFEVVARLQNRVVAVRVGSLAAELAVRFRCAHDSYAI